MKRGMHCNHDFFVDHETKSIDAIVSYFFHGFIELIMALVVRQLQPYSLQLCLMTMSINSLDVKAKMSTLHRPCANMSKNTGLKHKADWLAILKVI